MIYGYARVSTASQGRDGNSLEAQAEELRANGAEKVIEEVYTGTTTDRPKFAALLKKLKSGDTLMVAKLDRFARTAKEGLIVIDELNDRGIAVHILNMGLIDNQPVGKLMRTIFLAFAEFERDMIVQRTQEGKKVAKQNNPEYREGRKPIEFDRTLFQCLVSQIEHGTTTVTDAAQKLGMSRATFNRRRKELQTAS